MSCEYCGREDAEDVDVITRTAGDESMDICEDCYDNIFA